MTNKLRFWTDPHLGLNRTAHTTPTSRKNLREALFQKSLEAVDTPHPNFCLGDLFDTCNNDEYTIMQGAQIANRCYYVLAGNHDMSNRDSAVSSLEVVAALGKVALQPLRMVVGGMAVVMVPHFKTQAEFEATLKEEVEVEVARSAAYQRVLLLHCNYGCPHELTDSTLNLTREMALQLLDGPFDYILIGHEHNARSDFGGRLQILGNIHPTSFSDISDKFVWELEDETLTPIKVWDKETGYLELTPRQVKDKMYDASVPYQFIKVTGIVPGAELPDVCRAINALWTAFPSALMIRNDVRAEEVVLDNSIEIAKAVDIPSRITQELQGSILLPRWNAYLAQVGE